MRYPFHLGENLTALASARDFDAVLHLAGRHFDLIMNAHSQSQTLRKLRVVQLQATLTRAICSDVTVCRRMLSSWAHVSPARS